MALTNAQYDEIMRGYDKRQLQNKYIHDKRIEEAYRKAPRLRDCIRICQAGVQAHGW